MKNLLLLMCTAIVAMTSCKNAQNEAQKSGKEFKNAQNAFMKALQNAMIEKDRKEGKTISWYEGSEAYNSLIREMNLSDAYETDPVKRTKALREAVKRKGILTPEVADALDKQEAAAERMSSGK